MWLIFHGVKAVVMLLSLITFCSVAKHYVLRQRDEIVNEHYLVEEIYDRELRQAKQWKIERREERRLLFEHTSTSSSSSDDQSITNSYSESD